ncbi:hypothetical protein CROQUDRAFT_671445 [Cronartium quercuum f. sp. fusiforme G11]|uniref:beta-glucosidase n=1 Tax=Cronartium quercuum f. sp. fusiforme G11 TaxID=708437 RepID=A0A9P6NFJ1_9BASI|nr:hypothetical protein CROQUDRAFT_671445 [Cronartium quercuum f. sp. fusiforme G11]
MGLLSTGPCDGTTSEVNSSVYFPAICMNDGPSGLRVSDDLVSAFPAGISVAATWNPRLMRARGQALGQEARMKGIHVLLGPAADVTRAPEGGRTWESFGADAYLNGEAVYETIVGIQSEGVQACAKHLIGNHQEQYRFTSTSKIDDKTLRELYFLPFKRAVDAGVTCMMCSYNKFNGDWSCRNPALISEDGLLRKEGGFQGYVVSDWGASHGSRLKSVHESVDAGLDVEMPGELLPFPAAGGVYNKLKEAVEANLVSQASVDKMASRVISGWLKVEQDKRCSKVSFHMHDKNKNEYVNVRTKAHISLIREIGAASAVLLKNVNGALPLSPPATLAIIGMDAAPIAKTDCWMNACQFHGTISVGWGSGSNCLKHVIAPVIAIEAALSERNASTKVVTSLNDNIKSAVSAAKSADVAIVFVYTGEIMYGHTKVEGVLGDRPNLNLLGNGEELIKSVAAANQNTIVVIHSVGSVVMESWVDLPSVKGVFMAGLPGEQSGPAIADVLFGNVNPSGRLPYTIAKHEEDFGVKTVPQSLGNGVAPIIEYTEGIWTDYRRLNKLNITARFCFGYGLSYTTFAYSKVTNTGTRDGTEIVQLYLSFPTEFGQPEKQLKGFDSVFIPKGESRQVSIPLRRQDMSLYDMQSRKWITPTRGFHILVGSSLNDIHLEGSL